MKPSGASLEGEKARRNTAKKPIEMAKAEAAHVRTRIDDMNLRSTVEGRFHYRLAEEGEVLGNGGKVLTLVNLGDVYMKIHLPAQEAVKAKIGADARIVLDIASEYAARAKVRSSPPRPKSRPSRSRTATNATS